MRFSVFQNTINFDFSQKKWQRYDKTQESGVGRWLIYQPLAGFLLKSTLVSTCPNSPRVCPKAWWKLLDSCMWLEVCSRTSQTPSLPPSTPSITRRCQHLQRRQRACFSSPVQILCTIDFLCLRMTTVVTVRVWDTTKCKLDWTRLWSRQWRRLGNIASGIGVIYFHLFSLSQFHLLCYSSKTSVHIQHLPSGSLFKELHEMPAWYSVHPCSSLWWAINNAFLSPVWLWLTHKCASLVGDAKPGFQG